MRAITLAAALAAMLAAGRAAAEDLRLSWRAPAGCPSGERVRDAALKSAGTNAAREPIDAEAHVERGQRWQVTIRTTRSGTAAAERRLEAASCEALADATAVILAIAMIPAADAVETAKASAKTTADGDADASVAASPKTDGDGSPTADAGPAGGRAAIPPDADRPDAAARKAHPHAFAGSVSAATDATTLPSPAVGGRLGLAWTPGRARVELAGSYFAGQSKTTGTSLAGARFRLVVAGGRACWAVLEGTVEIAPCAGADVQMMSARGFGATQNYAPNSAWMSVAAGARVRVPLLSWLALRADADAIVPITRPRFVVEGDGAVHQPAAIGVRAGIGAELLFL